MGCNCGITQRQGKEYCQGCMPDEYSWLIRVNEKPDPFLMDNSHAYITPNNTVYVLDHTRSKAIPLGGNGGTGDINLKNYALRSDLEEKVKDLLAEIAGVRAKIKDYKAGTNIEITPDNVINNTYRFDDKNIQDRLFALENKDIPIYLAGSGITIGPDKTISAEVTLAKVNELVNNAVADTEINLNSANLVIEGDNLVWKGTLNTGRQITSSVPLSALGVNQSAIDELKRRLTAVENKADNDRQTLSFNNTSRQLTISNGNSVTIPDTRYVGRQNIVIEGNAIIAKEYVEYTSSVHQLRSPLQPLSGGAYVKQGLEGDTVRKFNTANGDAWLQMGIYYIKQSDMAQALMWPQSIVEEYLQVIDDVKASDDDPNTPYTPKLIRGNTRLTYVDRPDVFVERTGTHYDLYLFRLNNNEYEFKYEFIPKVEGVNVRTMAGYIKDIRDKTTYPETLNYSVTGGRNYSITKDQLYSQIGRMRGLYRTWLTHYVYIDPRFATTNKPK